MSEFTPVTAKSLETTGALDAAKRDGLAGMIEREATVVLGSDLHGQVKDQLIEVGESLLSRRIDSGYEALKAKYVQGTAAVMRGLELDEGSAELELFSSGVYGRSLARRVDRGEDLVAVNQQIVVARNTFAQEKGVDPEIPTLLVNIFDIRNPDRRKAVLKKLGQPHLREGVYEQLRNK